ncbi:MAG: hypothetical protein IJI24_00550 [Lachnospiraceae bacterium]|nr:hypothetical protein [Lachnospiraceae bacterium]
MLSFFKCAGWNRWLRAVVFVMLSLLLPVTVHAREGWQEEYLGEWILDDEAYSTLMITGVSGETVSFSASFYRLAAFDGGANVSEMGEEAGFWAEDGSSFSGWIQFESNRILLHTNSMNGMYTDYLDDHTFSYHRDGFSIPSQEPEITQQEPDISRQKLEITPQELEERIEWIREHYYNPGEGDVNIPLENGTWDIHYSRIYYYFQGELIFAFIFDGSEEHRLYFLDDHMIRYIDENMITYDYPDLDYFADWEEWALSEAYTLMPRPEPSKTQGSSSQGSQDSPIVLDIPGLQTKGWIGTWLSDDGDRLEITGEDDSGITLVYYKTDASGGALATQYVLPYLDETRQSAAEDDSVIANGGWRYVFYLDGDAITVESRYPDKVFWRVS